MKYTKIIKRPDGARYEIKVNAYDDRSKGIIYNVSVQICLSGKRKFLDVFDNDNFQYRALSMEDREKYRARMYSIHVSKEEIADACLECWEKLKPDNNLKF